MFNTVDFILPRFSEICIKFEERIEYNTKLCEQIREETEVAFETFEKRASNLPEELANTREICE